MAKEIESISSALFDKIRSRFANITLGDEKAKAVTDPTDARFFNFTYTDEAGNKFGKVTLSLIDETSLKVYYGQSISKEMDRDQRHEWYEFLRNLRQFARRNLLTFDTRDINKSNLDLKDVKQQAKTDSVSTTDDVTVTESKLYGTSRNSYADVGECRLLIKHDGLVSDEKHGDRARRIREIFIETGRGERLLCPFTNLHGARAMAEHINQGGTMHDERAKHIGNIVKEMSAMTHFVRSTKNRQFEDRETTDMIRSAVHHYDKLKRTLRQMRGARGYRSYFETFVPDIPVESEVDVDALRERFVRKIYDDRFNDALPYVYRAYQHEKNTPAGEMGSELEEWADDVFEDTWAKPDNEDKLRALQELLKTSVRVGIDGIDAQAKIEPLIGDDDLDEAIYQLSQSQGPDADARALIKTWVQQHMPGLLDKLEFGQKNSQDAETNYTPQVSPEVGADQYGATTEHPNVSNMTMEDKEDPLTFLKSLAGLTN